MDNFDIFRIDGHTLRVFLTVFETCSVSRAAEVFDLNQSTISHTIDKMRVAVRDPLFVKSGRGITPTEKSMIIAPQVQSILSALEGLVAVGDYNPAIDTLPMRVGLPTPALMPQMKSVYDIISAKAPNVQFQVHRLAPRERMQEMLTLGEIDLAISINMTKLPPTLNSIRFGRDTLVVYYDPKTRDPITTLQEYIDARHGVAGYGGKGKSVVETALAEQGLQRDINFTSPTTSTLGQFITGTDMIATMPLGLSRESYRNLAHCAPPIEMPDITYDLVWHRRFEGSGRNLWFRQLLLDNATSDGATQDPSSFTVPD
ncbi:MAG: LysR family transcriptional regulator [Roseobacter sp.]